MTDAEDHVRKADAALAAAIEAKARLDERWPDGAETVAYLLAHGTFLDLLQIVNTHANLATAKAMVEMQARHVPVVFSTGSPLPGDTFVGAKDPAGMGGVSEELAAVRAGLCPIHHLALVDGRCPESTLPHPPFEGHVPRPAGWPSHPECAVVTDLDWKDTVERRCSCGTLVYGGPRHSCHAGAVEARGLAGLVRGCVARWQRAEPRSVLGVLARRLSAVRLAWSGAIGTAAGLAGACGGLPSSSEHLAGLVGVSACTRGHVRERASARSYAHARTRGRG